MYKIFRAVRPFKSRHTEIRINRWSVWPSNESASLSKRRILNSNPGPGAP